MTKVVTLTIYLHTPGMMRSLNKEENLNYF